MRTKIVDLSKALRAAHKIFLENERIVAEKVMEKSLDPYSFLAALTQDKSFEWIKPFSALLAEIDAFEDEAEEITQGDLIRFKQKVEALLLASQDKLGSRYREQLMHDGDLMLAHAKVHQVLRGFVSTPPAK